MFQIRMHLLFCISWHEVYLYPIAAEEEFQALCFDYGIELDDEVCPTVPCSCSYLLRCAL